MKTNLQVVQAVNSLNLSIEERERKKPVEAEEKTGRLSFLPRMGKRSGISETLRTQINRPILARRIFNLFY